MKHDPVDIIKIRDAAIDTAPIFATIQQNMAQRPPANLPAFPQFDRVESKTAVNATAPNLNPLLVELMGMPPLREVKFSSTAPVVGSILVAVRRAWNWMSTKWYVLPIIQQQAAINQQLVTLLNEMVAWQEIQADMITQLNTRIEALVNQHDSAEGS
jgi:hypothetical protein